MTTTQADWPNRETMSAYTAAQYRALRCCKVINDSLALVVERLNNEGPGKEDARELLEQAGQLTEALATLDTLREVRGWHQVDTDQHGMPAEQNAEPPYRPRAHFHLHTHHEGTRIEQAPHAHLHEHATPAHSHDHNHPR